jgi:hypothetical protein
MISDYFCIVYRIWIYSCKATGMGNNPGSKIKKAPITGFVIGAFEINSWY